MGLLGRILLKQLLNDGIPAKIDALSNDYCMG
jgi:hypothetical protein